VEKVTELCAIQIIVNDVHFIILCIYASPTGNFNHFLNLLGATLTHLYKPKMEFLLCGNLNVNYLSDSNCTHQISILLQSYNMAHSADFPTRTHKTSSTANDGILVDYTRINSFKISPLINGLSDHDVKGFGTAIKSVDLR
jgi:hypothetical protein